MVKILNSSNLIKIIIRRENVESIAGDLVLC